MIVALRATMQIDPLTRRYTKLVGLSGGADN